MSSVKFSFGALVLIFIELSESLSAPALPCTESVQVGYDDDCEWHWQCFEGDWWLLQCPIGWLFDRVTGICVPTNEATCYSGSTLPDSCVPNFNGKIPYRSNCNRFTFCSDGIRSKLAKFWNGFYLIDIYF